MSTLKQKTIKGFAWSFIDNVTGRGISFIISLILARLLTPKDFGLLGMITIFIAVSHSLIDSGFSQALIRKKNCTQVDYSTVFYFNLVVSIFIFIILFFAAPYVSNFFNQPLLKNLLRVLSIVVLFDAFTIIQRTILTKRVNFKLQTIISVIANIFSGLIGIYLAYTGYGVWSLIVQILIKSFINSALLWFWNKWIPSLIFCKKSFKELFSFGSKLLLVGIINTTYKHIFHIIIGKFFSPQQLGYYTRAHMFKDIASTNISTVIQRVSYPVLSNLQDDSTKLKASYKKLIKTTMFITFVLMLGMAALAEPMIIILIGEKWRPSIYFLQLLCFAGMMYPLHALNLNMLNVKGRSDLFLRLEIIKKILMLPVIFIGIVYGIEIMLILMIVQTQISYILNSFWSGKLINYPMREQVRDILPSFLIAAVTAIAVFLLGCILPYTYIYKIIIQIILSVILVIGLSEITKIDSYIYIKEIVKPQISKLFKQK